MTIKITKSDLDNIIFTCKQHENNRAFFGGLFSRFSPGLRKIIALRDQLNSEKRDALTFPEEADLFASFPKPEANQRISFVLRQCFLALSRQNEHLSNHLMRLHKSGFLTEEKYTEVVSTANTLALLNTHHISSPTPEELAIMLKNPFVLELMIELKHLGLLTAQNRRALFLPEHAWLLTQEGLDVCWSKIPFTRLNQVHFNTLLKFATIEDEVVRINAITQFATSLTLENSFALASDDALISVPEEIAEELQLPLDEERPTLPPCPANLYHFFADKTHFNQQPDYASTQELGG